LNNDLTNSRASADQHEDPNQRIQTQITPATALVILQEGNKRFVNNLKANRDLLKQVNETSTGQHPFAVILSCIDSRTSAELIFDQGLGDVFSVRIAGNCVNEDILGSMEFACKVVGVKLIVVLGHSSCGAVKGACDDVRMGNLTALLNKIRPAVDDVRGSGSGTGADPEFVERVAGRNVELAMQQITQRSPILKEMVDSKSIGIVGGMYDVQTGVVAFLAL
jgi:carbonic anhydrase